MTTAPFRRTATQPGVRLSLVEPVADEPVPEESMEDSTRTPGISRFEASAFSESLIAIKIGELITHASSSYREGMSGHEDLDLKRLTKRRQFAFEAFKEFGMLQTMIETSDEATARETFSTEFYNPAESQLEQTDRSEANQLIENRFNHPVVRAANRWTLISGDSNKNMRNDAVRVTRAVAIILESIGEEKYQGDLEL